jgi:formate--tetrahydrofolate ligase
MAKTALDDIARRLELKEDAIDPRGRQVLKVDPTRVESDRRGRVVLVTAMTPTPAGEGKTTTSIGLVDGLNRRGVMAVGALREPSLGPLFGLKGGAIGGGLSRVVPSEQINMHFTGDIHAVTSAHNLLSALLDNHLFADRAPALDPGRISWGRTLDMNDRALRSCQVGFATKKGPVRQERFDITAASEVMAVLCMSRDVENLRARLDDIVVGMTPDGAPVTAKDLGAGGAMAAILLDAARPNLVRTLEDHPVFVHGGPFANIAQGTSTLIQTQLCRRLADVVVTEAGFAFDLGGFKFLDIKCRAGGFRPAAVVLVVTVRALRHHGGVDHAAGPNAAAVSAGLENVGAHLDAMQRLGLPVPLVAINRFPDDSAEELALVKAYCEEHGARAVEGEHFARGGEGALGLADALMERLAADDANSPAYKAPYDLDDAVPEKLRKAARVVLGAEDVELTEQAQRDLEGIERVGLGKGAPICFAKTHLSISDDKAVQGRPPPFRMKVTGLRPSAGAGFVVALCGPILTMPGLPDEPAAAGVDLARDVDGEWQITGLR